MSSVRVGVVVRCSSERDWCYTNAFVRRKPHTRLFKEEGVIANHPKWPLVIYKSAVRMPGDSTKRRGTKVAGQMFILRS